MHYQVARRLGVVIDSDEEEEEDDDGGILAAHSKTSPSASPNTTVRLSAALTNILLPRSKDNISKHQPNESVNRLLVWKIVGTVQVPDAFPTEFKDRLLVPGSGYEYAVRAVNHVGHGKWSATSVVMNTKPKNPSKPSPPVLSKAAGTHSLALTWLPPAGSKLHIRLKYDISILYVKLEDVEDKRDILLKDWSKIRSSDIVERDYTPGKNVRATIQNLLPGASLQIKIRAKNYTGEGEYSRISEIFKTASSVPDPVPPSLVEFLEDRQIGVKWNRPPCRGDPITMYELQRNPVGKTWESMGNWKTELRTKNMFYCVPNLLPATSHGFRVRAYNSLGWGEFGTPCQSIRTESDVPSQPSAPYMISWNGTVVSIAWTHKGRIALDNKEDNGSPLIQYEIQRLGTGAFWETIGSSRPKDRHYEYLEPKTQGK